jgi:hypothetical protein
LIRQAYAFQYYLGRTGQVSCQTDPALLRRDLTQAVEQPGMVAECRRLRQPARAGTHVQVQYRPDPNQDPGTNEISRSKEKSTIAEATAGANGNTVKPITSATPDESLNKIFEILEA